MTEETVAGSALLRIDVPPVDDRDGAYGQQLPARPQFTQYFNSSSIFSITPCTEEVARQAADSFRDYPVELVDFQSARPRPRIEGMETDDDDEVF